MATPTNDNYSAGSGETIYFGSIAPVGLEDLTINPSNPRYFNVNGQILFGGANTDLSQDAATYEPALDAWAAANANSGRIWTVLPWAPLGTPFPWARSATPGANDGGNKFDFDVWDTAFWDRVKAMAAYAHGLGIYLQYMLFDEVGLEVGTDRYFKNPWNDDNNINSIGLPGGNVSGTTAFYNTGNAVAQSYQEAYVDKVIAELSAYKNVYVEVCNETTANLTWQTKYIDYAQVNSDFVVANNPFTEQAGNFSNANLNKFNVHNLTGPNTNQWFVDNWAEGKALDYNEQALITDPTLSDLQQAAWGAVCGAGHFNWDEAGPLVSLAEKQALTDEVATLFNSRTIGFLTAQPSNGLTNNGYCLADAGNLYLNYAHAGGNVTLDISAVSGTIPYEWYEPSTKTFHVGGTATSGPAVVFVPPFGGRSVLLVQ